MIDTHDLALIVSNNLSAPSVPGQRSVLGEESDWMEDICIYAVEFVIETTKLNKELGEKLPFR